MPYYGDGSSAYSGYYSTGVTGSASAGFANHSSLMTGVNRYFNPIAARYSPHLSTISETPSLMHLRRHAHHQSSSITSLSRPRRIIDTADIDVSKPPRSHTQDNHQQRHRLRRDRPTIKIRSQALKDNPALREYNEKHEKTVGELLVEKFMIKDKNAPERKMRLYHQVSLLRPEPDDVMTKEKENEILAAIARRVTRRMTRRRSSADVIPLDPEQIKREAALQAAQAEVLDTLVAQEQAEIECEVRRGTFAKRPAMRLQPEVSESEDDAESERKIHATAKKKKRKKSLEKPPPLPVESDEEEDDDADDILEIAESIIEEEEEEEEDFKWDDRKKCDDIRTVLSDKDDRTIKSDTSDNFLTKKLDNKLRTVSSEPVKSEIEQRLDQMNAKIKNLKKEVRETDRRENDKMILKKSESEETSVNDERRLKSSLKRTKSAPLEPTGYKIEACNSVGDFSTLYVKANNVTEQFRESIRLPAPPVSTEVVVVRQKKPYVRDTSRNSVYLALKPSQNIRTIDDTRKEDDDDQSRPAKCDDHHYNNHRSIIENDASCEKSTIALGGGDAFVSWWDDTPEQGSGQVISVVEQNEVVKDLLKPKLEDKVSEKVNIELDEKISDPKNKSKIIVNGVKDRKDKVDTLVNDELHLIKNKTTKVQDKSKLKESKEKVEVVTVDEKVKSKTAKKTVRLQDKIVVESSKEVKDKTEISSSDETVKNKIEVPTEENLDKNEKITVSDLQEKLKLISDSSKQKKDKLGAKTENEKIKKVVEASPKKTLKKEIETKASDLQDKTLADTSKETKSKTKEIVKPKSKLETLPKPQLDKKVDDLLSKSEKITESLEENKDKFVIIPVSEKAENKIPDKVNELTEEKSKPLVETSDKDTKSTTVEIKDKPTEQIVETKNKVSDKRTEKVIIERKDSKEKVPVKVLETKDKVTSKTADKQKEKLLENLTGNKEKLSTKTVDTKENLTDKKVEKLSESQEKVNNKNETVFEEVTEKILDTKQQLAPEKLSENTEKVISKVEDKKEIDTSEIKEKVSEKVPDTKDKVISKPTETKKTTTNKIRDPNEKVTEKTIDTKVEVTDKSIDKEEKVPEKLAETKEITVSKLLDKKESVANKTTKNIIEAKEEIPEILPENKEKEISQLQDKKEIVTEIEEKVPEEVFKNKDKVISKPTETKETVTNKTTDPKEKLAEKTIDSKAKVSEKLSQNKDKAISKTPETKETKDIKKKVVELKQKEEKSEVRPASPQKKAPKVPIEELREKSTSPTNENKRKITEKKSGLHNELIKPESMRHDRRHLPLIPEEQQSSDNKSAPEPSLAPPKKDKDEKRRKVDSEAVMKIEKKILEDAESPDKILTSALPAPKEADAKTASTEIDFWNEIGTDKVQSRKDTGEDRKSLKLDFPAKTPEEEDDEEKTPLISQPATPLVENLSQVPLANLQDRSTSERSSTVKKISKWTNHDNLSNINDTDADVTPIASKDASPQVSTVTKKKIVKKKKSTVTKKKASDKGDSTKSTTGTKKTKKTTASPQTSQLKTPMSAFGSPRNTPAQRPPELNKLFYSTPAILLTATPRDLQKVRRAKAKRKKPPTRTPSLSSDSTGSTRSTATTTSTEEGSNCEEDADHKRLASTRSNDSGFDGSPRLSSPVYKRHGRKSFVRRRLRPYLNAYGYVDPMADLSDVYVDAVETPSQSSENQRNADSDHFQNSGRITPPATNLPRFKKYEVTDFNFLKVLGKGSFGKVLLAELRGTECVYAVKCLKKDVVLEDDDVECTLIERKVLTLATRHPYLCHLFCTFQTESHLFFVMEYLNGGDLMFHIQKSGRFSEARAKFYAAEIWSGLIFLHKKGIVYRDLKLDNVLLDFEGHIRIADFGMCKLQIFLDRTADTFCGTPDYMAPEIIKGLKYNQAVDWWSFGVLLYEMLTGQSPFSGCDEDELFWSICNERPFIPRYLSQSSTDMLVCLLEKDAGKRIPGHEIACHPFFCTIQWEKLERRALEAPFKPAVEHTLDTRYFDTAFTTERPRLTPVPEQILTSMDQAVFRGFSYTNPNATD